jgi:adenylate cyclase
MGEYREVLRKFRRRLWSRVPVANAIGVALSAASGLVANSPKGSPGFNLTDLVVLAAYVVPVFAALCWLIPRIERQATRWLGEGRQPTAIEQRKVMALPWLVAAWSMAGWAGGAVVFGVRYSIAYSGAYTLSIALTILLGGLTTSGLTYLLVEWALRPVVALAFAGTVPERSGAPGVRAKLLLSWAVGSDVFLLMIGLAYLGRSAQRPPSAAAVWYIIAAGLLAGSLVFWMATRSLAAPLVAMRQALRRVQEGDLDTRVTVNDGGELGLLQAGFNQMVAGLAERRRLEDLFGRHVGEDVARLALEGGVSLGGERRHASMIFVDIIGSSALARRHRPESVVELLNLFFGAVVRVVAAEGGWVNKFEGDGALCVFGVPVATADHAERALRAARTLRRELLALSAAHPELDAGIGVSSGLVVAGNVGTEQRYEYTVIGTPVNQAARLADEAKSRLGRVLAGEGAVSAAGGEVSGWRVAGEVALRGQGEPVLVFEPVGVVAVEQPAR